jgi:hypothetical protein
MQSCRPQNALLGCVAFFIASVSITRDMNHRRSDQTDFFP